ncbi:hypothetical protein F4775DRAFT_542934 [Biscogniauxia sp. FL1348]|nr:hypothetical protein F4775DRAFT_542934 [Biscogniauxia sp. FL1348]
MKHRSSMVAFSCWAAKESCSRIVPRLSRRRAASYNRQTTNNSTLKRMYCQVVSLSSPPVSAVIYSSLLLSSQLMIALPSVFLFAKPLPLTRFLFFVLTHTRARAHFTLPLSSNCPDKLHENMYFPAAIPTLG